MDDNKISNNNNGNSTNKQNSDRNSREGGPSEEPPVKKRKNEKNKMCVSTLMVRDIKQILSDIESGKDISTCDCDGKNAMHYASEFNWLNVVEAIVNKPNCRNLINSLNKRRESPVVIAAKNSNKYIVTCLLKYGAKFEIADEYGMTLFHYASVKGWLDIVQDVLSKGFNINALTFKRETALTVAAKHLNEELVSFLIGKMADCSYCNQEGWGILHFATKNGWLKTVLTVVNNGVDINAKTVESETPLLLAAKLSYKEIVKALVDLEANVHCCDSKGWSLLHYASSYGWFDVVVSVVNKDADINSKTNISETPLLLAAKNSYKDIVTFFINSGVTFNCFDKCSRSMLSYSSRNGWLDVVAYAVHIGMDLNAETTSHFTALRYAVAHKKEDVVSYLISEGANYQFCDKKGWTILHYAAARGWHDIAQCVLEKVDINAKSSRSATALLIACIYFQKEVATLLIDAGADIHCTDRFNKTILHHAARNGWPDVALSALEQGVYVDSLCVNNETALLVAAQHSHPDVACLLSVFGANANLFDHHEKTVLHYAAERGWVDVVKAVIKNNADLNVMNNTDDTPLHLTCMFNKLEVLKCLLEAGADYNKKAPGPRRMTPFNYAVRKSFIRDTRSMVTAVALFIENGAFPQSDDYVFITESPLLKEGILRNKKLCTQAVINRFNNHDLPRIYLLKFPCTLPPIDHVKIGKDHKVIKEIEDQVLRKMDANGGYCNLSELYFDQPCSLSMSAVRVIVAACFRYIAVW